LFLLLLAALALPILFKAVMCANRLGLVDVLKSVDAASDWTAVDADVGFCDADGPIIGGDGNNRHTAGGGNDMICTLELNNTNTLLTI